MSQTPYEPPAAPAAPVPVGPPKLFTPEHIAIATFLGSPLAGGLVISMTLRRLSRNADAMKALLGGLAFTAALLAIAFAVPSVERVGWGLAIGSVFGMRQWARTLIGPAVDEHKKASGPMASGWAAAGMGLGVFVALFGAYMGLALAGPARVRDALTDCATVGEGEVCFEDGATADEARAVGKALVDLGLPPGEKLSVKISRQNGTTALWFVVKDGAWDRDASVAAFTEIGGKVRDTAFGGRAIEVRLADDSWVSHRSISITGS